MHKMTVLLVLGSYILMCAHVGTIGIVCGGIFFIIAAIILFRGS
jgi:hypothetical protein